MSAEDLRVMTLAQFVRERPDTHVGSVAKVAALRWIIGWKHELSTLPLDLPILTQSHEDTRRLRAQQYILLGDATISTKKRKRPSQEPDVASVPPPLTENKDDNDDAASMDTASRLSISTDDTPVTTTQPSTKPEACVARVLVEVSPALEKIVDEILQNALDRQHKDDQMKRIDVTVDVARGRVVVRNDGMGMPVPKPERTNERVPDAYWPTIVCTVDMAGGNFVSAPGGHYAGGRNGIGMKATNILSKYFCFEVNDAINHFHFVQEWRDGMTIASEPRVRPIKPAARGFVQVTFEPDLAFFGEDASTGFSAPVAALIRSRAWEIAAHTRAIVTLDGTRLPLRASMAGLAALFRAGHAGTKTVPLTAKHALADGRVVLDMTLLPARDGVPADMIGFVNGIRCSRGAHVEYVLKTIGSAILDTVRRKTKRSDLKTITAAQVRGVLFAVISVNIDGPAFNHQNKAELDSPEPTWGWKWTPDAAFCARACVLFADDIAAVLVSRSEQKALAAANALTDGSSSRRIVNIAKYEPADNAGCPDTRAVLVLTEGDSAHALAMTGRAVRGSKDMGVFCLKGKPPNPRGKSIMKLADNKVLANVAKILGLEYGRVFVSEADIRKRLNYRCGCMLCELCTVR